MNPDRVRLILDSSAILAYAHESVAVGELIAEITDEQAFFVAWESDLVAAAMRCKPDAWPLLDVLHDHPHRLMLDLIGLHPRHAAAQLYGPERAEVVCTAWGRPGAYILTAEPEAYGSLPTIAI